MTDGQTSRTTTTGSFYKKTTKNRKLHKFATTNNILEKKMIILDMHHHITYMNFNLQQFCVSIDKSKPYSQIYLQIIARCTNLQLLIVVMKKSILLEMNHHETYMYINFQQNRVNRSVIIVHINVFAKKSQVA